MKKDLITKINDHNIQVYRDIAEKILEKKQGLFTCIIKIDGKFITDLTLLDGSPYGK